MLFLIQKRKQKIELNIVSLDETTSEENLESERDKRGRECVRE